MSVGSLAAELRAALRHLYDPNALRASPVGAFLTPVAAEDMATEVYQALIDTIESLRPGDETPRHSRMWRTHETLHYRYVEQFGQAQVADQLDLSVRQLRREEKAALISLAYAFAQRYDLPLIRNGDEEQPADDEESVASPPSSSRGAAVASSGTTLTQQASAEERADLERLLPDVLDIVGPLVTRYDVSLQGGEETCALSVRGSPVLLRQALLSLLTVGLHACRGGNVRLSATARPNGAVVSIRGTGQGGHCSPLSADDLANLEASEKLAQVLGANLALGHDEQACHFELTLDRPNLCKVLVIDDHADTQQLLERYTRGTRYQCHAVTDPNQAVEEALAICPDVIILDVMMPSADGWQVLAWLKQVPQLGRVPIAVCTVLPHQELALARGVDAFIAKPFSRDAFLRSLEELTSTHGQPKPAAAARR